MADWKDILSGRDEKISEEDLVKYLEGNLSEQEKYEIEHKISSSSFTDDAVDGLREIDDKRNLQLYVEQLNKNLRKHLNERKLKKERRRIKDYPWILISVIIVLLLCIVAYAVIHIHKNRKLSPVQQQSVSLVARPRT